MVSFVLGEVDDDIGVFFYTVLKVCYYYWLLTLSLYKLIKKY